MIPTRLLLIAAAVLAALAALVVGVHLVYRSGYSAGAEAKEAELAAQVAEQRREDQRLASQMVATARAQQASAMELAEQLKQEVGDAKHALVRAPRCAAAAGPRGRAADGAAAGAGVGGAPGAISGTGITRGRGGAELQPQLPDDVGLRLTGHAVRVWNGALFGPADARDPGRAAPRPDGADPADADATTALTLEDAWRNHIDNATACRLNRLAHQQLLDFIQARQAPR